MTAFKVFLTLAELGRAGVQSLVDRQVEMADRLRALLRTDGWTVANDTPLPLVCFTREGLGPAETTALVERVVTEGGAWISEVRLPGGVRWLRACITHHEVGAEDAAALVHALGRALSSEPCGPRRGAAAR